MHTVLHKAATRGHAHYGWLNSWHSFSSGSYYDGARMHFGALRVLNDDTVMGGAGFGQHPHDNMEIISIPLEGTLEHSDSMGNTQIIQKGDVQIMSAGTGITHSEKNKDRDMPVKLLQIWVFPSAKNVAPRYEQRFFSDAEKQNKLCTVVAPIGTGEGIGIHQDAWISMGNLAQGLTVTYNLKKETNGVYAFLIEGDVTINDIVLNRRDGLGITGADALRITANQDATLLLMEVPV